jgi:hypothetical protein
MPLADLWAWLESLPIAMYIGESWWFPLLESIHVLTATFLVGSIAMVDLRLLGLAANQHAISRIVREVVPWTLGAYALSIAAGLGLFVTRASHYMGNVAFQVKLVLLVLAAINMALFHLSTTRGISQWDTAAITSARARWAGASSLVLWAGILLAGRWIGHLS